jgi:hypothetical protein
MASKKICLHQTLVKVINDPPSVHYGKLICSQCGRFIKWIPNPHTIERVIQQEVLINQMIDVYHTRMSSYEIIFLSDIKSNKFLLPKQLLFFEELKKKYQLS